jgi:hypothetical protein
VAGRHVQTAPLPLAQDYEGALLVLEAGGPGALTALDELGLAAPPG